MNITQKSKLEALRNLIERIARASAGGIVYTTALLGIIYLFPGMKLPPELALIAGGVGVNAIAIILERLSQEEKKQDHENYVITVDHAYARLACNAVSESGFKSAVSKEKFFEIVNAIQCRKDVSNNGLPELLQYLNSLNIGTTSEKNVSVDLYGRYFSDEIKEELAKVNRDIETLTEEQFRIIEWLKLHRRAVIDGCAGSGKTLVAAEKARRLRKAGLETLLICHNPNLAKWIKKLVEGVQVEVFDFNKWVSLYGCSVNQESDNWSHYYEPDQNELDMAFDNISRSVKKYDAIIVDEGQDFRDIWWVLIEAALKDQEKGILYIFADDNQALLPQRAKYPVEVAPFSLSKNCRNSGKIYDVVARFHSQLPETSLLLKNRGIYKASSFAVNFQSPLALAIMDAEEVGTPIIITTEPDPIENSLLNNLSLDYIPKEYRWQGLLTNDLNEILSSIENPTYKSTRVLVTEPVPKFSNNIKPNLEDIESVNKFARLLEHRYSKYDLRGNYAHLITHDWELGEFSYPDKIINWLHFFQRKDWFSRYPQPKQYFISPSLPGSKDSSTNIALYNTASIKGLEGDVVIVFVMPQTDIEARLYVSLSRARFYLHLVAERSIASLFADIFK